MCALGCDSGLVDRHTFCAECQTTLATERADPTCPTCAGSVAPYEVVDGLCRMCRAKPTKIGGTVRVGPYRGCHRQIIHAYKYHGREEFEPILSHWLSEAIREVPWFDRVDAIVPVPTHWRRRFWRPLYPAEALVNMIRRRLGLPRAGVLRRVRAGPHQIGLSYTQRHENVHGAFAMRRGVELHGARLLLIDDVKTTGATVEECARILKRAGASEVFAAVLVKVDWRPFAGGAIHGV